MKAAVVNSFSSPPVYSEFTDPAPAADETLITVSAAALSPLVKSQAAGQHYSSKAVFPFIPGVDGVGKLPDGTRVYFAFPATPFGSMAQQAAVNNKLYIPIPDELDAATAAALANPGMSSWAALTIRAKIAVGETVLVNGATGSAGRLAVQIAKHLGAKKVIATGRNQAALEALPDLGADVIISLEQPEEDLVRQFKQEIGTVNIVLDYLWGKSAELLITAASGHRSAGEAEPRLRFVQIGAISGPAISLPGASLRSSGLELLGSGLGSVSNHDLIKAIGGLLNSAVPAKLSIEIEAAPLADVETAWVKEIGNKRLVFTV